MRQTSPESVGIFELLLELYVICDGDWEWLARRTNLSNREINNFLDYAATFLSNVGNYYVRRRDGHGSLAQLTNTGLWRSEIRARYVSRSTEEAGFSNNPKCCIVRGDS
jgi:hypothetical protein